MAGIDYRPEIDGLRALAVIPVVLFHAAPRWLPGGFIGVDVFFVISGFLITSIITRELDHGTFTFRGFWARRIRRILPALIVVTACTLGATYACVFRPEQQLIGAQALAALASFANIFFCRTGDYWGPAAEESPFLHAWSLSVEEQFYLLFPVAVWLLVRFRPRWLSGCIAGVALISLALFLWGTKARPVEAFYLLPFRIWELGTGCLVAVVLANTLPTRSSLGALAAAGLGVVALSYVFIDRLGVGVALAVLGTALILAFGHAGPCRTVLSVRPLVHMGKLSYSLYLWHWPLLALAPHLGIDWPGSSDKAVIVVASYALALATYQFVEKPTRRRRGVVPYILLAGTLVAVAALTMAEVPRLYDTSRFRDARFVNYSPRPTWVKQQAPLFWNVVQENPGYTPDAMARGGIRVGDPLVAPDVVVVGNSHAEMWSDAIATIAKEESIPTAFFSQCGENLFDAGFQRERSLVYEFIRRWKPKVVIVGMNWRNRQETDLEPFLEFAGTNGATVLLVEDPPWVLPCGARSFVQWLASRGFVPSDGIKQYLPIEDEAADEGGRRLVRSLAKRYDFVRLVPTHDLFVSESRVLVLDGRDVVYIDDDHLSSFGAHLAVGRLKEAIVAALDEGDGRHPDGG